MRNSVGMLFSALAFILMGDAYEANADSSIKISDQQTIERCERLTALPRMHGREIGVPFDQIQPKSATAACAAAVSIDPNNPKLRFDLGRAQDAQNDFKSAIENYKIAINGHYFPAIYNLAQLYLFGNGVKQNYGEALHLFRVSSKLGDIRAITRVGEFYANGNDVKRNAKTALRWYHKAASLGDTDAMNHIATMYDKWSTANPNPRVAFYWYHRAAALGDVSAMENLGSYYRFKKPFERFAKPFDAFGVPATHGQGDALEWFRKAARLGDCDAMLDISTVDEDIDDAVDWFTRGLRCSKSVTYSIFTWVNGTEAFRSALEERLKSEGAYAGPIDGHWNRQLEGAFASLGKISAE